MKVLPVDDGHVAYCLGCEQMVNGNIAAIQLMN